MSEESNVVNDPQEDPTNSLTTQSSEPINLALIEDRSVVFLSTMKKTDMLSPELMNTVIKLAPELRESFQDQVIWRTSTEMEVSVLNDSNFPDNASKFFQSKLEQLVDMPSISVMI